MAEGSHSSEKFPLKTSFGFGSVTFDQVPTRCKGYHLELIIGEDLKDGLPSVEKERAPTVYSTLTEELKRWRVSHPTPNSPFANVSPGYLLTAPIGNPINRGIHDKTMKHC